MVGYGDDYRATDAVMDAVVVMDAVMGTELQNYRITELQELQNYRIIISYHTETERFFRVQYCTIRNHLRLLR